MLSFLLLYIYTGPVQSYVSDSGVAAEHECMTLTLRLTVESRQGYQCHTIHVEHLYWPTLTVSLL